MKNIEILGPGCPRCKQLAENAEKAVAELGLNAHVEKVSDMKRILARGVISTPGIAVDGVLKGSGRVYTVEDIKAMLTA